MTSRPVGKTKDAGWQIGVSRTVAVDLDEAWEYLTSRMGIEVWLGAGVDPPLAKGLRYETDEGTTGEIRSLRERDRIRLTWQPSDRSVHATSQIALTPAASGCTFRFHSERLFDEEEREAMRLHWQGIADRIERDLSTARDR